MGLVAVMNDMSGLGMGGARPAAAGAIPASDAPVAPAFDNAREPIGIVLELAGSGSAIALDLQRLQECIEDGDPSIALAGQVGSQVKIQVGKSWLLASVRSQRQDSKTPGGILAKIDFMGEGNEERLTKVQGSKLKVQSWAAALGEISELLRKAAAGSVAIVASARQTNEELFLLKKLATKLGAITDSVPRAGEADKLLVVADKNPNTNGAILTGIVDCHAEMGRNFPKMADGIRAGKIKTLIVFGEDVTKHGIGTDLLAKLDTLIVSDILPNKTTEAAHYLLPGCAHAEKRGSFTNIKGRVQRFTKAVEPKGDARPEWEFLHELVHNVTGQNGFVSIEGLFNQMAKEVPGFNGVTWASLGDTGVTVQI